MMLDPCKFCWLILVLTRSSAQVVTPFDPFATVFTIFAPTMAPSATPSASPSKSSVPSMTPSDEPSVSQIPSSRPSGEPSVSWKPSGKPSSYPSRFPSTEPSTSGIPSLPPSTLPSLSSMPSIRPSGSPSTDPSQGPSLSLVPSLEPSQNPSMSIAPSLAPSTSSQPSRDTPRPSSSPTMSDQPSFDPTSLASNSPSLKPSVDPTSRPSGVPSSSSVPSLSPSGQPSLSAIPSASETTQTPSFLTPVSVSMSPSTVPSIKPSSRIIFGPTNSPTDEPSYIPSTTSVPSLLPSQTPSRSDFTPTRNPSEKPSTTDSLTPTQTESMQPSVSYPPSLFFSQNPSRSQSIPTESPSQSPNTLLSPGPSGGDSIETPSVSPSEMESSSPSRQFVVPTENPTTFEPSNSIPPTGFACFSNTTEIFIRLSSSSPNEMKEYILCPNTIFEIGMVNGQNGMMPLITRSNTVYKCGSDGKSGNNCILFGGEIHVGNSPEFFEEPAFNVFFEGITFRNAENIGLVLRNEGSLAFIDCIIEEMENTAPVFIDFSPSRRRLQASYRPFGQDAGKYNAVDSSPRQQYLPFGDTEESGNIFGDEPVEPKSAPGNFIDNDTDHSLNIADAQGKSQRRPFQSVTFHSTMFRANSQRDGTAVIIVGSKFNRLSVMRGQFQGNIFDRNGTSIFSRDASLVVTDTSFDDNIFNGQGLLVIFGSGSYRGLRNSIATNDVSRPCDEVAIVQTDNTVVCFSINANGSDPLGSNGKGSTKSKRSKQAKASDPKQNLVVKNTKSSKSVRKRKSLKSRTSGSNSGARRDRLSSQGRLS